MLFDFFKIKKHCIEDDFPTQWFGLLTKLVCPIFCILLVAYSNSLFLFRFKGNFIFWKIYFVGSGE
jgi:hypothetical protein